MAAVRFKLESLTDPPDSGHLGEPVVRLDALLGSSADRAERREGLEHPVGDLLEPAGDHQEPHHDQQAAGAPLQVAAGPAERPEAQRAARP